MSDAAPALSVHSLSYSYGGGKRALSEVTLEARMGRFTALLGPNGAGKTTLFSLVTGLLAGHEGNIAIAGFDTARQHRAALASMGIVFQQPTLDLDLTVEQNLVYSSALHGIGRRDAAGRIERELARLDLGGRRRDKVRTLNGGHRRRVEIARSLLHEPRVLILDEPTVGLDIPTREMIVRHAHQLASDDGIAVVWATHLIDEILDGDDVLVLHQGRIVAHGDVSDVMQAGGGVSLGDSFNALTGGCA